MYTRFKSQKSGIKLGINTITNTTRSRVVITAGGGNSSVGSGANTGVAINTNTFNDVNKKLDNNNNLIVNSNNSSSKSESLSSSSSSSLTSIPNALVNSALTSTATVVLAEQPVILNNKNTTNESNNTETTIPLYPNDCLNLSTSKLIRSTSNSKKDSNKNSNKNNNTEETIDPNCITYVKSLWEKYSSEIGTQNGPLRHVDENSQYPHLNGFVAFDMEHWWAERSISCMINERPSSTLSSSSSTNSNESIPTQTTTTTSSTIKTTNSLILNECSLVNGINTLNNNKSNSYKLSPTSMQHSLHNLHAFQLCFS